MYNYCYCTLNLLASVLELCTKKRSVIIMAAAWKVTLVLIAVLPVCVHAVVLEPLVITISKDGSDEKVCLSGKVPCKTFEYACTEVDGNGSDVTMIITYTQ